jgi:hypothetical protein
MSKTRKDCDGMRMCDRLAWEEKKNDRISGLSNIEMNDMHFQC